MTARQPAYWKAENLDEFDGRVWRRSAGQLRRSTSSADNPRAVAALDAAHQGLDPQPAHGPVHHRGLRVRRSRSRGCDVIPTLDGLYVPPRTLRRGDAYTARVYTPRPTERQRRAAGRRLRRQPGRVHDDRHRRARRPGRRPRADDVPVLRHRPDADHLRPAAQRAAGRGAARERPVPHLRARAAARGRRRARPTTTCSACSTTSAATSTPTARCRRRSRRTLDGFLFDGKQGYCQQFSGAMALLLRMAGIPARVVTGFSTGATDTKTGEFIVRDFDAHSWVEVYYPGWGWLTFDPTPAASPARSQPADSASVPGSSHRLDPAFGGDPLAERGAGVPVAAESAPWWRIPAIVAGALALLGLLALARPPLAPRRAAGALRARARAAAHAPRAGARDDPARARAALRPAPPRRPATCARCARAATATSRAIRPARSAAACGPSSDAEAASWAAFVPGGPSRRR